MQRHFSNRGEALAEVTAARMLGRRKRSPQSAFTTQPRRGTRSEVWFARPEEATPSRRKKQDNAKTAPPSLGCMSVPPRRTYGTDTDG